MEYKDYYKTLGVARDATPDDIKRAYRKLARKYHPDISKEADASQRMAEINEANAVLSDPEKRAAYDALADAPRRSAGAGGFQPPPDWEGQDFHFRSGDGAMPDGDADFSEFFSQMFGQGARARHAGGGQHRPPPDLRGQDQHASIELDLLDSYHGAQRSLHLRSTVLDEDGRPVARDKELQVSIPKGVREGQMIRLAGQGAQGLGKGPAGDLLLQVHLRHDPRWWAEGKDVYQPIALAPWEAALGGTVRLATIAGEFDVGIPAGSRAGRKLRIKGNGLPAATPGDLYLVLGISLPEPQTDAQRKAYEALAQAFPSFDARQHGTGQGASR